jgi:hypothetical protein
VTQSQNTQRPTTNQTQTPGQATNQGTNQSNQSGGSASQLRGMGLDDQNAALAPPAGPPNIKFAYNEATLAQMAAGDEVAAAVYEKYRQFEDSSTKEGVKLTPQDKLALSVQVMNELGVSLQDQKIFLTRVFFGHASRSQFGTDQIWIIDSSGGGVTLRFSGNRGTINPMFFGAPPVYTGKDDNLRGRRVEAAKNGYTDAATGRQIAVEKDSVIFAEANLIEQQFLMTQGVDFAQMTKEERAASPAYKDAFTAYKTLLMKDYVAKVSNMLMATFGAWVDAQGPTATPAAIVQQAINLTLGTPIADYFRRPHNEMRVEDEAIIEVMLAQVNIEGNVNSDNFGDMSRVVDKRPRPPVVQTPATEEADKVATEDPETTTTVDQLPKTNTLIKHLEAMEKRTTGLSVEADSNFYKGLGAAGQATWNAHGFGAAPCVHNGTISTKSLATFVPLMHTWRTWEDAKLNGGDDKKAQAAFDAAAEAFLCAPAHSGVTIGG